MHHLGVPTTRALSLVTTGEEVWRDMMYDGNPKAEPGAVVCRVAPSFLRLGNYQILTVRNEIDNLKKLADFTIQNFYSHLGTPSKEVYGEWVKEVCERTAHMVVHWMRVGFVHGVMNTDNLSVLGLTIDYGPYGWLENYDPDWTPNTTDAQHRRYRYGAQPEICTLESTPVCRGHLPAHPRRQTFGKCFVALCKSDAGRAPKHVFEKLGLTQDRGDADTTLIQNLLRCMQSTETDMTLFFRALAKLDLNEPVSWLERLKHVYYDPEDFERHHQEAMNDWLSAYGQRVNEEALSDDERQKSMNAINPKYVMRNYLAQLAIDLAEEGDGSKVKELLEVMRRPYDEQPQYEDYADKRPEWARRRVGCSMLSCSS